MKPQNKTDSKVDVAPAGTVAKPIRFGVRGKLQTAFGAVALMTIVAAGIGIVSFSATEREFQRVASRDVPMMTMMMTRMQTKRMESSPTSRRSSANPRKTRGYGDGIALPGIAGPGAAACDSGDWIPEPV